MGTCYRSGSSPLCPTSRPAFLPVREPPPRVATASHPSRSGPSPFFRNVGPAGMMPQHAEKQGAFMACGSDSRQERKEKRGRRNSVVVAQFLEIQRKMFLRHLRLNITKTKIISAPSCMDSSSPIQPSPSPSKPWVQFVPRSRQFCLYTIFSSLFISVLQLSL